MSQLDLSESAAFELISEKHRRYVIDVLADQESPLTLSELVDAVAAKEQEVLVDMADNSALSVRLYHVDLPKLHKHGIIEFDPSADRIQPTDKLPALRQYINTSTA
jgi:predicted transcriptional regulator